MISGVSHAQVTTATITGQITDTSKAVVSGTTVSVTNVDTGIVTKATSNDTGIFRISGLQPGLYRANVSKAGFKSIVKEGIALHAEDNVELNFNLEVGSVNESVTVAAGEPQIETQSTSMGTTIEGRQVQDAPLNGRNAMNLISLTPGVVPQGSSQGAAITTQNGNYNPAGLGNYQIGGGIAGWNSTYVDGANVNASGQNWQALIPTQDSVSEFRVDSNAVTPQYGRFAGGIVNFSTRPGTNQFHGAAYEYLRNTIFDANLFFNNRLHSPVPVLHQHQFGAVLGGPIIKDKSFFLFSWESLRVLTENTARYRAPTAAEMAGDFRADGPTYDIKTGARANCNGVLDTICASSLDQTAQAMYNAKPSYFAPVETDPSKLALLQSAGYNGQILSKQPSTADQYIVRLDHALTNSQRLFARYTLWKVNRPLPSAIAAPAVPTGPTASTTHQVVIGDNITLSPSLNLDIRAAYTRFIFDVGTAGNGKYDLSQFGPNWAAIGSQLSFTAPPTFFPGSSWFGQPSTLDLQQHNHNNNYSLNANLTKVVGRHSLQFGGEIRRIEYYSAASIYPSGNFNTAPISGLPANVGVNSGIANFVEGQTTSVGQINVVQAPSAYEYYQGYYVTDAWQVRSNLTANLGVRWELPGAWYERNDRNSVLIPNKANPLGSFANPVPGGPTQLMGLVVAVNSPDYNQSEQTNLHMNLFEPRVGLNYTINPLTVLRGGFGISHPCLDCGSVATEVSASTLNSASTLQAVDSRGFGSLSNPFPSGVGKPLGRSLQLMQPYSQFKSTLIGQSVAGEIPYDPFTYVMQWNLNAERAIGSTTSTMLSYIGSRGVHLGASDINLNQLPDQYDSLGDQLIQPVANPLAGIASPLGQVGGPTALYGRFLMPYPQFTKFTANGQHYGESIYHGMIATIKKRLNDGGVVNGAYTWSHMITNNDSQNGYLEPGQTNGGFGPQDYTNHRADRSNSSADVRQRFTLQYILDLPVGKGKRFLNSSNAVVNGLVSGWSFDGITTYQTGFPVGFYTATGNRLSSLFGSGSIRPNVIPGVSKKVSGSRYDRTLPGNTWFNTAAFAAPAATSYVFGNESRLDPELRNDSFINWDMNLSKKTQIHERVTLEFRAEYFNIFNRPQFGFNGPNSTTNLQAGGKTFGQISTTVNQPRIGQFSLRASF
jgi:hypothetical protein